MSTTSGSPASELSTADLHTSVEAAVGRSRGADRRITRIERRQALRSSSYALEELDVELDDGRVLPLMFKNLSRQAMLDAARDAKPAFLYDPLREIETYANILDPDQLGTARCYGTVVDPQQDRYWLLLERVPGLELCFVGLAGWRAAAGWLADMHRRFAMVGDSLVDQPPTHLLRYSADFYRLWMRRADTFLRGHLGQSRAISKGNLALLADQHKRVVERLEALPTTFVHGEFYGANVIAQELASGWRICPVDWEMAGVGPGLLDLAALTAGSWTEEERADLVSTYYLALVQDRDAIAPAEFHTALNCCLFQLAVQWLGWSPVWTPPPEQAHDWLHEALRLAEMLEL